jgi:hypothetical protein
MTIDLLKAAVGDLQTAAAKLGRELQRVEDLAPLARIFHSFCVF